MSASLTVYSSRSTGVLLKQTETNALNLFRRRYIGMPTMLLRPIKATFLPSIPSDPTVPRISYSMAITASGVQEMKYGAWRFNARLPMLNGCSPSTSFSGPIKSMIFSWSRCTGKGN